MSSRFDNLIPIRKRISGEQLAGWRPTCVAESGLGCRLESDVMIPMSDGVRLSADLYRPRRGERHPAIVQMAAYSRELHTAGVPTGANEIGSPPVFTERGYAQVVLTRRGMGRSEGAWASFLSDREVTDCCEAIEWVAAQPWCSGDVLMFGTSYYGMIQPMVAARRPKSLRAFFANEICTDFFRHLTHYAGTPNHDFFALWTGANFKESDLTRYVPPVRRALIGQLVNRPWFWKRIIHPRVDRIFGRLADQVPSDEARSTFADIVFRRKGRDDGGLSRGSFEVLDRIEVPFVVVQNLAQWNIHQFGSYDLFERAGTPADRRYLILGKPEYELPVYSWQLEALAFFDWIVKGVENGYREQPAVRYFVEGAGAYAGAVRFPIPAARRVRLHLARGGEDRDAPELILDAPNARAPSGDPGAGADAGASARSVDADRWIGIPLGTHQLAGIERAVAQSLSYRYRIDRAIRLAGPVTLALRFSCNEIDSFLVARLSRRGPDGTSHLLAMGALSPARRRINEVLSTSCELAIDYDHPEPLVPGQPVALRFSLTPAASDLRAGDELLLDIASRSDLLRRRGAARRARPSARTSRDVVRCARRRARGTIALIWKRSARSTASAPVLRAATRLRRAARQSSSSAPIRMHHATERRCSGVSRRPAKGTSRTSRSKRC